MNPFQARYDRCNDVPAITQQATLPAGPAIIDLEPVGLCNFTCVMCPTGLGALGRPSGFMTEKTFGHILDKTEAHRTALRFIGFGEPMMHPKIVDMVAMASADYRLSHLNTNGSKMTPGFALALVNAGLSSIKFSFQGTDAESFEAMRRVDFFEELLEAIAMMSEARGDRVHPYIAASTTTTDETPEQIEAFRARLEPLVDHLGIGKTIFEFIDMAAVPRKQRARLEEAAKTAQVIKRHPDPCPEVWQKLSIHWDGTVVVCCNDYSNQTNLGNINTDSLASIWHHPTMEAYRERLTRKEYTGPLCRSCYDYMTVTKGTEESDVCSGRPGQEVLRESP